MATKKEAFKQGKTLGISGREMFLFNPELMGGDDDDEDGGGVIELVREEEEEEESVVDLTNFTVPTGPSAETVKSKGETSSEAGKNDPPPLLCL